MSGIIGIDPGIATGGLVLLNLPPDEERILAVKRLASKPQKLDTIGDPLFTNAVSRAKQVVTTALEFVRAHEPELIAIESFVDLPSRARQKNAAGEIMFNQNRWMTPLVIGGLVVALEREGFGGKLSFQNPAILSQFKQEIVKLTEANRQRPRKDILLKGDRRLTSDHLIKAWCHGTWARDRYFK